MRPDKLHKSFLTMHALLIFYMAGTAHADVVPLSKWSPRIGNHKLEINGKPWLVYNAQSVAWGGTFYNPNNDWAIRQTGPDMVRFEVRKGDQNWFDRKTTKERSEIGMVEHLPLNTPIRVRYTMMLEKGPPNTAKWLVLGQIHQEFPKGVSATSAPFAINLYKDKLLIVARWGKPGAYQAKQFFTDARVDRGRTYAMDIRATFGARGRLIVLRDGMLLVDYAGPLGYEFDTKVYWKMGIYRLPARTGGEKLAVNFSLPSVTVGTRK